MNEIMKGCPYILIHLGVECRPDTLVSGRVTCASHRVTTAAGPRQNSYAQSWRQTSTSCGEHGPDTILKNIIPLVTNHNVIRRSGDAERFRYKPFSLLQPPGRNVHHPNRACTTNGDLQIVLENPLFRTLTEPKSPVLICSF
jgi:hypothetical protein